MLNQKTFKPLQGTTAGAAIAQKKKPDYKSAGTFQDRSLLSGPMYRGIGQNRKLGA